MTDESLAIDIGGQNVSLADLADLNLADIEEKRFELLPAGIYRFKNLECKPGVANVEIGGVAAKRPKYTFMAEVVACLHCNQKDYDKDLDKLKKKKHGHNITIMEIPEDYGRVVAMLIDTGFVSDRSQLGKLDEAVEKFKGFEYEAELIHRPNDRDKDRPFVNVKDGTFKPAGTWQAAA